MIKNLLLSTDFSDQARRAYTAAVALSREYGATIHLVNVAEPLPPFCYIGVEGIGSLLPRGDYYDKLRESLAEEARSPALEGLPVATHLLFESTPFEALVNFVQEKDMDIIIMSTHGRTGLGHTLLGSVTEKVVRHSPVPVLTYRRREGGTEPPSPRSVLVPFDFSDNAKAVLRIVRFLSEHYGTTFTFLNVLEQDHLLFDHFASDAYLEAVHRVATEAPARIRQEFAALQRRELPGIAAEFESRHGTPYREIVTRAEEIEADLIVMATHGWTGLKHFFMGSVAERVVREAPCPVLTVHPQEVQPGAAGRV